MRLAATLTPLETSRDGERQPVALRGTLRDSHDAPSEIVVVDISESGFLAELPDEVALPIEARVRVAATLLGTHEAIVVRRDGGRYGFAFAQRIDPRVVRSLDGEQPSTVTPFPWARRAVPAGQGAAVLSPRASLAIMVAVSGGIWAVLAAIVAGISYLG